MEKKKGIFFLFSCITHVGAEYCPGFLQLLFYSVPVGLLTVGTQCLAADPLSPEQTESPT